MLILLAQVQSNRGTARLPAVIPRNRESADCQRTARVAIITAVARWYVKVYFLPLAHHDSQLVSFARFFGAQYANEAIDAMPSLQLEVWQSVISQSARFTPSTHDNLYANTSNGKRALYNIGITRPNCYKSVSLDLVSDRQLLYRGSVGHVCSDNFAR